MSPHESERSEFERLLTAHAHGELDADGAAALAAEVATDPERAALVEGLDQVRQVLADERALRAAAMAPVEPREEADEVFVALTRAAARAEQGVLATALAMPVAAPRAPRRLGVWLAAAAGVLLVLWFAIDAWRGGGAPADTRLGPGARILLEPELRRDDPVISWHAVVGARTYAGAIVDASDRTVVVRSDEQARSTVWRLSEAEYERVRAHGGRLFLRVTARDGAGFELASTGDLELSVK